MDSTSTNVSWDLLASLLTSNTPFCFHKMNDGEMAVVSNHETAVVSRGAQRFEATLRDKLIEALQHTQDNYFVGMPCQTCYKGHYELAKSYCNSEWNANILINHNFTKSLNLFYELLPKRRVVLICNQGAMVDKLWFKPYKILYVPKENGWDSYEQVKDEWKVLQPGDVVLLCCGPLGRVLAYEYFRYNPQITCLELGSFFEPWTNRRTHMYQTGNSVPCSECFLPVDEIDLGIPKEILDQCTNFERVYWSDMSFERLQHLYWFHKPTLVRVYDIAARSAENDERRQFYISNRDRLRFELSVRKAKTDEDKLRVIEEARRRHPNVLDHVYELTKTLENVDIKLRLLDELSDVAYPTDISETQLKLDGLQKPNEDLYTYRILHDLVVEAYYAGRYELSFKSYMKLMARMHQVPLHLQRLVIDNGRYALMMLGLNWSL